MANEIRLALKTIIERLDKIIELLEPKSLKETTTRAEHDIGFYGSYDYHKPDEVMW